MTGPHLLTERSLYGTRDGSERAYREAGVRDWVVASDAGGLDTAVARGLPVVTDDYTVVCDAASIDAIVEATGAVEFGCHVVLRAIENGKHVVLLNAKVDATVGTVLSLRARERGVIYTGCDGDQPGVEMNLVRFVRGIGLTPLVYGNIKGLQDRFRTPTTQAAAFAERWGQNGSSSPSVVMGSRHAARFER